MRGERTIRPAPFLFGQTLANSYQPPPVLFPCCCTASGLKYTKYVCTCRRLHPEKSLAGFLIIFCCELALGELLSCELAEKGFYFEGSCCPGVLYRRMPFVSSGEIMYEILQSIKA